MPGPDKAPHLCPGSEPEDEAEMEKDIKVAIVHYWLVGMRGGEKVVEALCELFPQADIFTHVYNPDRISNEIQRHSVKTTFISRLPFARTHYQNYLPLMPFALEQLDLRKYDLVISSESGPAKGVITRPDALHICYCHTPMRYVWSAYHAYRARSNLLIRILMPAVMHRLRIWDVASASRVDHFIANSYNVADRIRKYYRREAVVVYPPVDLREPSGTTPTEDFYLLVGQIVAYKGVDVAIDAFNRLGKRLVVIGHGEAFQKLKQMAGPTIEMLGWQDDATLRDYYARCRALIFVADEDFGMVPVEAMSAGRPVIAFGRGGALETVIPGKTGVLFDDQTAESLIDAISHFEAIEPSFDRQGIARHAQRFTKQEFKIQIVDLITRWTSEQRRATQPPQTWDTVPTRRPVAAA